MAENSAISWCTHTFNPWLGCQKVSPACDFCYAEAWAKRAGWPELWQGERRRTTPQNWQKPVKWNKRCGELGVRESVFCLSLGDIMDNQVDPQWRTDLFTLVYETPHLDWLFLTKRPQNVLKMLVESYFPDVENVVFGTTVENQEEADRRRPSMAAVAAAGWKTFVSYEPALEPVDWTGWEFIGCLISGGESGGKARGSLRSSFRGARDFALANDIRYHHKQNGEFIDADELALAINTAAGQAAGTHLCTYDDALRLAGRRLVEHQSDGSTLIRVGVEAAGRLLDGVEHLGMPA